MRGRMDDRSMRRKLRPLLSALLTIAMLLSLLPTAAFAKGETGTFTKITTQEDLTNGKYVMVVDGGYAVGALEGTWLTATQVTDEEGSLTNPAANLVWEIAVTDGGVTLTDANSIQVAPNGGNKNGIKAGDYTWAISFENGTFRFLGTGADTVTLASNKNSGNKFRAYKNTTINAGYPCDFTLYQYVEGTGSTEPGGDTDPQPGESPIKADDSVVFYMPAENKVMTTTASGSKLAGQEGTLENGILTTAKEAAVFTVATNEEGQFTFSVGGKYLTSGETGNSLTMEDTATDYSYWTLEEQGEGWLVKNVSAQYNGGAQYIEYYSGFTTYGYSSNNAGIYTFQFFQADKVQEPGSTPEPEPGDGPIYDGEQVVIYNPAYGKALSGTYTGYYNNGTTVTMENGTLSGFTSSDVWTVIDNGDGTWSFSYDGKNITNNEALEYTGNAVEPTVVVRNSDNETLTEGTDYTWKLVDAEGNEVESATEVGTYKVVVTYNGDDTGAEKELTFKIDKAEIESAKATADFFGIPSDGAATPTFVGYTQPGCKGQEFELASDLVSVRYYETVDADEDGEPDMTSGSYDKGDAVKDYTGDVQVLIEARNLKISWDLARARLAEDPCLSEELIQEAQGLVTMGTYKEKLLLAGERPGTFKLENYVGGPASVGIPAVEVPHAVGVLADDVNTELEAGGRHLTIAAYLHARLSEIHPFADGNGRTARLLMNGVLLAMGMPPIVIRAQDHGAYHAGLDVFHLEGDLSPFRRFLRNETLLTWEGLID